MAENQSSTSSAAVKWESLCKRCGCCCYEKIDYNGKIYLTDKPCEYLNLVTRQCNVYATRCLVKDGCVALTPKIVALGVLPKNCAYVRSVKNYCAPLPWDVLPKKIRDSLVPCDH
jgi:hypothetical protein